MEYALVAETEHRSDGEQEHKMEVYFDYTLATGKPVSEHRSDGEVITIPNTLKEAIESPQATKREKSTDKEMDSLQKHAVLDLVSPDSVPPEPKAVGIKWVLNVRPTARRKVEYIQGWRKVPGIDCGCAYATVSRIQSIRMTCVMAASED